MGHRISDSAQLTHALKSTVALVLAGGRGTRLRDLTDFEAKPAVPFGGKYRLIDFPLSNCVNSGLRRVAVLTQYRAHTIIQHVQKAWGFFRAEFNEFFQVWPAQQQTPSGSWYLGTADAVYQNLDMIQSLNPEYVVILGGDHIYKQDYAQMLADHIITEADVTVSCVEAPLKEARGFGVMRVNDKDQVIAFQEKPENPAPIPDLPKRALASMGIYIFKFDVLLNALLEDAKDDHSSHDFGADLLPRLVLDKKVFAHRFSRSCIRQNEASEPYWRDVGTVDAYWEANIDLTSVVPELDLYDQNWPIWTYQAQFPAAKFVFDDDGRRGMAIDSLVAAGCIVSGAKVRRTLLFTNVRVNSGCVVEESVLLSHCDIGRGCQLTKVIVDQGCRVPAGLIVGKDPQVDQKYFHRTEAGVTLITEMALERMKKEQT
ncbi:glucose-1-phosphate adenylyltransferase [Magnetococcales bacterium HHB-1]